MEHILSLPAREVEDWAVLLGGLGLFFTHSRALNYFASLCFFCITMATVLAPAEHMSYWVMGSVALFVTMGFVKSLGLVVLVGKAYDITDEDILSALSCVGLGWLFRIVPRMIGSRSSHSRAPVTPGKRWPSQPDDAAVFAAVTPPLSSDQSPVLLPSALVDHTAGEDSSCESSVISSSSSSDSSNGIPEKMGGNLQKRCGDD